MAVLGRLLVGSSERLDLPDLLSVDSYTAADFKYLVQSFIGSNRPYILKGFEVIDPQDSIGTESLSIGIAESVVYYPGSKAGAFYYGLPEGNLNAQPLVPELRKNAINFVYLTFNTFDTAKDSRAFWDPDQNNGAGGEFSQDVNTESVLRVDVNVSVSTFPDNTIPICKVKMGTTAIESIQDCRDMMFRLGTGGILPNPFSSYNFRNDPTSLYARSESPSTITTGSQPNPFQGGDKNILTLKEWMDVVMTKLKELSGTTYWYGGGNPTINVSNIFLDTLASTIKSKGQWQHSGTVAGQATWTEDIHYVSLRDQRDLILRASTVTIPDEQVAWIDLTRDDEINNSFQAVDWLAGSNIVNGLPGSFVNLVQGDFVKKKSDVLTLYLRVEEFYALPNLAGGTTTPAFAQSIKLSANYAGTTGPEIGEYTKGEYTVADIQISSRGDAAILNAAGNFFWLAYRSDTKLGLASAIPTTLSLTISEADGQRARITSGAAHGLVDGDRITIVGATVSGYNGTYIVDVGDTTNFYIETTTIGAATASAFYAIITTASRSTSDGFLLETANHGFQSNEHITINGTTYSGNYLINVRSATTFQIPIGSALSNPGATPGEIVVLPRLNVRTEFGTVKVVQGETTNIGDMDSQNLLSFIGMQSLAQTKPEYLLPPSYNALRGHQNYNTLVDDNLTVRAAKLTAMMADRVQDRSMQLIGRTNIKSETNGANQDISALSDLILVKPSSPDQTIILTSPISLPANSAIVADMDRDGSTSITPVVISLGNDLLLQENRVVLFYRFGTTTVYDWLGNILKPFGHINTAYPEDSQNRNVTVYVPGSVKLNPTTNLVTIDIKIAAEISEITTVTANSTPQSSFFRFNAANNTTLYYVWYNKNGAGIDPSGANPGRTGIMVALTTGQSATTVASLTTSAINTIAFADVTVASLSNVVTITNNADGEASDTVDGAVSTTFAFTTIQQGVGAPATAEIVIPGSSNNIVDAATINGLGTLLLLDGQSVWIRINRFAVKTFNTIATVDGPDTDVNGKLYITATTDVPIDQDVFVLWSRVDNNLLITHQAAREDGNVYEEFIDVVVGLPVSPYELQTVVPVNAIINLPPDSRDGSSVQEYIVGSGQLEMYLNGQSLRVGVDYLEVGTPGALSRKIKTLQTLNYPDALGFRIDANGAVFFANGGAGGTETLQDAYDNGRFIAVVTGQPVALTGTGKLLTIAGDMSVTGVIDPAGITFSQQVSSPFVATDFGLYRDSLDHLIYQRGVGTPLDISADFLYRDGTLAMTGNLDLGGFAITNTGRLVLTNTGTANDTLEVSQTNAGNTNPLIILHNEGAGPHLTVLTQPSVGETFRIWGGDSLGAGSSGFIDIRTIDPTGGGPTGDIDVTTGNSTASPVSVTGGIQISTGTAAVAATSGTSGNILIQTGSALSSSGSAGNISLVIGSSNGSGTGGPIILQAGSVAAGTGTGGSVIITAGANSNPGALGGDIHLNPGVGTLANGSVVLKGIVKRTEFATTNAVEEKYVDAITLTGTSPPTTAPELTFDSTIFEGCIIEYKIKDDTSLDVRVGTLHIATNNTSADITDSSVQTGDVGVSWSVVMIGNNVNVQYTTTANDKTMRADIKKFRI